ncbi:MAG TPA: ATP-binding cassette domain-containing protein [Kofleriaceae bacterium]|nr:ATP-binding cassette domain-containing protein [Kofleriaceae bacterium]
MQPEAFATIDPHAVQPARLEVQDGATSRVVLVRREELTIGRGAECDVVLAASWVAPVHVRIRLVAGAHHIVAEGDARVLLGGHTVDDAVLHDGDVVRLSDPATASLATLVYRNPLAPPIAKMHHFATPPGKALVTIGRAEADIVLDAPLVSRRHAELAWEGGKHVLRDCGSLHGTWVNGAPVKAPRALASGDEVQIGTFRLRYDGDSLDSFDQHGCIRLDVRKLRRLAGDRVILDETTLSIEPCEFIAIVGASGSGKSTLMMALCGFQRATSGQVAINGDDLYAGYDAYRSIVGYVPQDDILHRTLSVSRALHHAARLRLPADTAPEELEQRIAHVLDAVEMTPHRDKLVDQLSGGQRKRVSIACELLADPLLLFLDEPTSGLDPGLERKLMYTLRRLSDGGRTVVLITHATQNIRVCDHIAFLVAGKLVYFGPPSQALEFFGVDDFADIYGATDVADSARTWQEKYKGSLQHESYVVARPARAPEAPSHAQTAEKERRARTFALSRWRQLTILCRRYVELIAADRRNLALLLLQAPVIGLLLVLVSSSHGLTAGRIDAKKLIFMLATTGVWFGVINSAREICKEAPILRRERLAGLRAGPYVASKMIVLFGLVLVQSALLLGVMVTRVKLPADGILLPPLLELYVTVALAGLAGVGLGLAVSAVAATPDKATSFIPIVLVPQVVLAGIMFALTGVMSWVSWVVSARAAVDGLSATVDTNHLTFLVPLPDEPQYAHTPRVLLIAWAALVGQAFLFSAIAWVTLRRRR